jgi:hypothetical protein
MDLQSQINRIANTATGKNLNAAIVTFASFVITITPIDSLTHSLDH